MPIKDKTLIPEGLYCGTIKGDICPYWAINPDKPYQMNGYCHFLEKGDWDLNREAHIIEVYPDEDKEIKPAGTSCDFPWSLLWDQCKECGINM